MYLATVANMVFKRKRPVIDLALNIGLHHLEFELLGVGLVSSGSVNRLGTTLINAFLPWLGKHLRSSELMLEPSDGTQLVALRKPLLELRVVGSFVVFILGVWSCGSRAGRVLLISG